MPKALDNDFDFSRRRKSHDFSEWATGDVWAFIKGEDYKVTGDTFLAHAKAWAAKNDYGLESKIQPATDTAPEEVVLRFIDSETSDGGGFHPAEDESG